jgi:hypothetical protein
MNYNEPDCGTWDEGYDAGIKECIRGLDDLIKDFKDCRFDIVVRECQLLREQYQNNLERNL